MMPKLVSGSRDVAFLPEIREDPFFLPDLDVLLRHRAEELLCGHRFSVPRDREAPAAHEKDRLDRAKEQPLGIKPFTVPILLKRGSRRQVSQRVGPKEGCLHRCCAPGRLPDPGEVLHPHLIVGQFVLIVHDREKVLFTHVDRGEHVLAQPVEVDQVSLGKNPDQVLGLADPGLVAATEDTEILWAGLNHVSPLTDVAVDEIPADEVRLTGEEAEQGIKTKILHVDLVSFHEIERLFGGEAKPGSFQPPVAALLVERASFAAEAYPGSVKYCQHVLKLYGSSRSLMDCRHRREDGPLRFLRAGPHQ
ncbi:hypothetical protein DSECCO2_595170 [anaerobic digester metagenome]